MSESAASMADRALVCGGCGFDLRAATADRCPECGRRFDPGHLVDALIPWEQRKWIGRVRAYVLTVLMVLFRPGALVRKTERPVSLADAKRFRRVSVALAWAALLGAAWGLRGWAVIHKPWQGDWWDDPIKVLVSPWSFGVLSLGLLLALAAMSLATAAFFGGSRDTPPGRRVRVMAVGHYASAPLALLPILVALSLFGWGSSAGLENGGLQQPGQILADLAARLTPLPLFLAIAWALIWIGLTCYLLRATGHRRRRVIAASVGLPIAWAAAVVLVPLALQVFVAWAVLMARSLSWRG